MPVAHIWRTFAPSWTRSAFRLPHEASYGATWQARLVHTAVHSGRNRRPFTKVRTGNVEPHGTDTQVDYGKVAVDNVAPRGKDVVQEDEDGPDSVMGDMGWPKAAGPVMMTGPFGDNRTTQTPGFRSLSGREHCRSLSADKVSLSEDFRTLLDSNRPRLIQAGYKDEDLTKWTHAIEQLDFAHPLQLRQVFRKLLYRSKGDSAHNHIPWFVLIALTSYRSLSRPIIQLVLEYLLESAATQHHQVVSPIDAFMVSRMRLDPGRAQGRYPWWTDPALERMLPSNTAIVLILHSNLYFHARQAWPESLEAITSSFVRWNVGLTSSDLSLDEPPSQFNDRTSRRMWHQGTSTQTLIMNAALEILAIPTRSSSFKRAPLQEAAQVQIVQFMATRSPPLDLSRKGYRSIVSVQLMMKKTSEERRWTQLQSLSWPPWKEDKTGMDSNIGPEQGMSNAFHALSRMKEVGYVMRGWEDVARIYAGWDTDRSPTVQTRQFLGPVQDWQAETVRWSARIRTTRTLREAWAAFQAYQDSGVRLSATVCQVMVEKLLFDMRREVEVNEQPGDRYDPNKPHRLATSWMPGHESIEILPGEGREVWPAPPSAHQEIYTRTPPPTLHEFLNLMDDHEVTFDDGALSFLLPAVPDWESVVALLRRGRSEYLRKSHGDLMHFTQWYDSLPTSLRSLIFQRLLQFPAKYIPYSKNDQAPCIRVDNISLNYTTLALVFSFLQKEQNLDSNLPVYFMVTLARQAGLTKFNASLTDKRNAEAGLIEFQESFGSRGDEIVVYRPQLERMVALRMALNIVNLLRGRQYSLGTDAVTRLLLVAFNAAQSARSVLLDVGKRLSAGDDSDLSAEATRILVDESQKILSLISSEIRPLFFQLVDAPVERADQSIMPRLSMAPGPAMLHAAIRCFGAANDFEGIVELMRLMRDYWTELNAALVQDRNGQVMFRRVLAATQLFLTVGGDAARRDLSREHIREIFVNDFSAGHDKAEPGVVREIYKIAQAIEDKWGQWPTMEEVENYIMNRKERSGKL